MYFFRLFTIKTQKLNRSLLSTLLLLLFACSVSTQANNLQSLTQLTSQTIQSKNAHQPVQLIQQTTFEKHRALYLSAENQLKQGHLKQFKQTFAQLKDYPLYEYLEKEYLISQFSLANTSKIEAFLTRHKGKPVARKLRYKWLSWLAKNKHASAFLRHYQPMGSRSLECHQLNFRLKTNENPNDLSAHIESIWLSSKSLPKACDKLFANWQKTGHTITQKLIWQRLVKAVNTNNKRLASYLSRKLSKNNQEAAKLLTQVNKKPKTLQKINFRLPLSNKANDIIALGLKRLAWKKPEQAIKIWAYLGKKYTYKTQGDQLRRAIALSLAIDKSPLAIDWLTSLTHLNDSAINQWILSTYIEQQNWQAIASHSKQMSQLDKHTNKWQYWQAVAESKLGGAEKANQILASIADSRSYYGFLAANKLQKMPQLNQQSIKVSNTQFHQISNLPTSLRAYEFFKLNKLASARKEWNYLVEQTPHNQTVILAALAHTWGWQHQSILAFARSRQIDDVEKRFPLTHINDYEHHAQKHQIPATWAFAITRQESAFKPDARSSANARGLMQLTPGTAKQVARFEKSYRKPSQLYQPQTNIALGTAHLSQMYKKFNHPVLATAAYNAGQSRVVEWLKNSKLSDPVQWIEQIPYKETREYVKNVLTYQLIYAQLTNQSNIFISDLKNKPIESQL